MNNQNQWSRNGDGGPSQLIGTSKSGSCKGVHKGFGLGTAWGHGPAALARGRPGLWRSSSLKACVIDAVVTTVTKVLLKWTLTVRSIRVTSIFITSLAIEWEPGPTKTPGSFISTSSCWLRWDILNRWVFWDCNYKSSHWLYLLLFVRYLEHIKNNQGGKFLLLLLDSPESCEPSMIWPRLELCKVLIYSIIKVNRNLLNPLRYQYTALIMDMGIDKLVCSAQTGLQLTSEPGSLRPSTLILRCFYEIARANSINTASGRAVIEDSPHTTREDFITLQISHENCFNRNHFCCRQIILIYHILKTAQRRAGVVNNFSFTIFPTIRNILNKGRRSTPYWYNLFRNLRGWTLRYEHLIWCGIFNIFLERTLVYYCCITGIYEINIDKILTNSSYLNVIVPY